MYIQVTAITFILTVFALSCMQQTKEVKSTTEEIKIEMNMQQRITIITLGVTDLKKATDFYENNFGWTKSEASNENISFFNLNGIMLSLFERNELAKDAMVESEGTGFKGFTLSYNTRSEAEVDELINKLRERGVRIVKEPGKVFWGGYSSYISDMDGNLWEIAFNPFLVMDEAGNVKAD